MENFDFYLNIQKTLSEHTPPDNTNVHEGSQNLKNSAEKTNEVVSNAAGSQFTPLTKKGAIKIVWVKTDNLSHSAEKDSQAFSSVYYTAHSSFFGRKEEELKAEVKKMKLIQSEILTKGIGNINHLALESEEVSPIGGGYTVEVARAAGDFETLLNENGNRMDLKMALSFGNQFLQGLNSLHSIGYAYGDMKPENILVYTDTENIVEQEQGLPVDWNKDPKLTIKISDFGKAEQVRGETKAYKGNTRFVPPEGTLSLKGDIYSGGLVLIRTLESKFLTGDEKSLINIPEDQLDVPANESLVGIEKYAVEHKAFPLAANSGSVTGMIRRYRMGKLSDAEIQAQSKAISNYIDVLIERIKADIPDNNKSEAEGALDALSLLLKQMTNSDPAKRPSAEYCSSTFDLIEKKLNALMI